MTTSRIDVSDKVRAEAMKVGALARARLPDVYSALAGWALVNLGSQRAAAIVLEHIEALAAEKGGEGDVSSQ